MKCIICHNGRRRIHVLDKRDYLEQLVTHLVHLMRLMNEKKWSKILLFWEIVYQILKKLSQIYLGSLFPYYWWVEVSGYDRPKSHFHWVEITNIFTWCRASPFSPSGNNFILGKRSPSRSAGFSVTIFCPTFIVYCVLGKVEVAFGAYEKTSHPGSFCRGIYYKLFVF